jgi:ADP-ribosylglycohydrolase
MTSIESKLRGALYGLAIGDAMGAPVEGWSADRIRARFDTHDFTQFIAPTHGGDPAKGKGAGRITDDTLMTEALILAYEDAGQHLDAHGYARFLLPHIKGIKTWVPEHQLEMDLWDRLWFPEKYPWLRLVPNNEDPRAAGRGNCVNCGVAMWMMPVGAVNAGDPPAAYQEAAALALAHNESFALEAGAVMAAAAAEAFAAFATTETVLDVARALSREGTQKALVAAVDVASPDLDLHGFIARTRAAVAPYDQRTGHVSDDTPLATVVGSDLGRPSRVASIEELPVALAALRYGNGDFLRALRAGVCYGRDCDSIAGMAGALFGAIHGVDAIPLSLRQEADRANRRDFGELAARFAKVVSAILTADMVRFSRRVQSVHEP